MNEVSTIIRQSKHWEISFKDRSPTVMITHSEATRMQAELDQGCEAVYDLKGNRYSKAMIDKIQENKQRCRDLYSRQKQAESEAIQEAQFKDKKLKRIQFNKWIEDNPEKYSELLEAERDKLSDFMRDCDKNNSLAKAGVGIWWSDNIYKMK